MSTTHFSGPVDVGSSKYQAITASAYTVTNADSGKTFKLGGTGVAITLPAPKDGLNYKFLVTAAFATDYVITATGAICSGPIIEAGAIQACSAKTTFTLEDGVEVIGDVLTFESDGTVWAIQGNFQAGNSITIA